MLQPHYVSPRKLRSEASTRRQHAEAVKNTATALVDLLYVPSPSSSSINNSDEVEKSGKLRSFDLLLIDALCQDAFNNDRLLPALVVLLEQTHHNTTQHNATQHNATQQAQPPLSNSASHSISRTKSKLSSIPEEEEESKPQQPQHNTTQHSPVQQLVLKMCEEKINSFMKADPKERDKEDKKKSNNNITTSNGGTNNNKDIITTTTKKGKESKKKRKKDLDKEEMAFLLLFRGEGAASFLMSAFFDHEGALFLRQMVRSLFVFLRGVEQELSFSTPSLTESQDRMDDKGAQHIIAGAQIVFDFIWDAKQFIPPTILSTLRAITDLADSKGFQSVKRHLTATLFFLRFICPAIVRLEATPPLLKAFVQISKLLQNCASNIRFGDKEKGMTRFNEFIDKNKKKMKLLLKMLHEEPEKQQQQQQDEEQKQLQLRQQHLQTLFQLERQTEYVDSLVALRDHFAQSKGFIEKYTRNLLKSTNGISKLEEFTHRLMRLTAASLTVTPFELIGEMERKEIVFSQRILLPRSHHDDEASSLSSISSFSSASSGGSFNLLSSLASNSEDQEPHALEDLKFLANRHAAVITVPKKLSSLFLQGEAFVFKYFSELKRDPAAGKITIADDRFLLLRGRSLSAEFVLIAERQFGFATIEAADDFAFNLLYELGFCMSRHLCHAFKKRYKIEDPLLLYSIGACLFSFLGFASVEVSPETNPSTDATECSLYYHHSRCFEADAWNETMTKEQHKDIPKNPICVLQAGNWTGWTSLALNMPVVCAEVMCRARGEDACKYVMAHIATLDELVKAFKAKKRLSGNVAIPRFLNERLIKDSQKDGKKKGWFKSTFKKRTKKEAKSDQQQQVPPAKSASNTSIRRRSESSGSIELDASPLLEDSITETLTEEMKRQINKYYELLTLCPHNGKADFNGDRHVFFNSNGLAKDFFRMVGTLFGTSAKQKERAYRFSMHFLLELSQVLGKADRQQVSTRLHKQMDVTSFDKFEDIILTLFPLTMTLTGWGKVNILDLSRVLKDKPQSFCLVYEIEDSFESHSWTHSKNSESPRIRTRPVCIVAAGYTAGWCRQSVDFELACVEVECRAMGAPKCVFVMSADAYIEKHVKRVFKERKLADSHMGCLSMLEILKQKRQHASKGFHARVFN